MSYMRKYSLLAYNLLKGKIGNILLKLRYLKKSLEASYFPIPFEEYVSAMILTLILVSPFGFLLGVLIGIAIGMSALGGILSGILAMVVIDGLIAGLFIAYPQYRETMIKSNIDKYLPYAVTHMATIAGTGVPPQAIFQMIGKFKEYGIVAYISERIARNVVVFGYDILTAISEEAKRVPSSKLKDVLWTITSTIRTGGDLRTILMEKSKSLMEEQRRVEAKYIEFLSMMAEVYATVFVAGTIIIYVMVSIIGAIGGVPIPVKPFLQLFTYLIIPIASIAFIIVIDSTKPAGV